MIDSVRNRKEWKSYSENRYIPKVKELTDSEIKEMESRLLSESEEDRFKRHLESENQLVASIHESNRKSHLEIKKESLIRTFGKEEGLREYEEYLEFQKGKVSEASVRNSENNKHRMRAVVALKDGIIIKKWDSIGSVARDGLNVSCVSKVLLGKSKSHRDLQWEYYDDGHDLSTVQDNFDFESLKREYIIQRLYDGVVQQTYYGWPEVVGEGYNRPNIMAVIDGKRKSHGKFQWRYKPE